MSRPLYSRSFRLWHWLNAVIVLGLLGTVLLRKTFLSYKTNGAVIQEELAKLGNDITLDAAKAIAKTLREPMWDWHYIMGFALAALLLWRILLHVRERSMLFFSRVKRAPTLHKKGIYALYGGVYAVVSFMVLSGLIIYFSNALGLSDATAHTIKEVHEIGMYFFLLFVPAHIIGIIIAENSGQRGLISGMVGEGESNRM